MSAKLEKQKAKEEARRKAEEPVIEVAPVAGEDAEDKAEPDPGVTKEMLEKAEDQAMLYTKEVA